MPESYKKDVIRVDYRTGKKILFSSVRNNKPDDFYHISGDNWESDISKCPFEYGKEALNKTIKLVGGDEHSWKLKVIENKFPMLSPEFDFIPLEGLLEEKPAFGYCEVIFETPIHNLRFSQLGKEEYLRWLDTIIERENELYSRDRIKYVYVFKNEGPRSGASLSHTHSQIISFEEVPETIKDEQKKISEFIDSNHACLYEQILNYEKERVLVENNTFIAFAPFGSKMSSESLIMPKRHVNYVGLLSSEEKSDFVDILSKIIKTNEALFGKISYNILFHEVKDDETFIFMLRYAPEL
ncbi:MAG: galactose-1-phosphate uridylyltransferase [Candidatus Parvarchaeum acidophilus ARMAN-5]|uniref:Galactose-1-phosphate uridylyltransferase n=1 Tax=Candidatus Parvarchaeum acidophilus ARMAN-5 TaxID=662762 RepID=D6GUY9_PARA5|nr:MAG: galactose-1-phosphate uridylyltransferase [Candidatus Parvarchaeum acidophilus ARMAN-5]